MKTFNKQPGDVLDYDVNMSEWFAALIGDDIQSVAVAISSDSEDVPALVAGPLPHVPVQLIGTQPVAFKVWLGGGTHYVDYTVRCLVRTEQDRAKEVEFKIKVRDL